MAFNSNFNPKSHRSGKSLKLIRSWRGETTLRIGDDAIAVRCEASEYEERGRVSITGSLDGDFTGHEDAAEAVLVFDGRDVDVQLVDPSAEGADFRSR